MLSKNNRIKDKNLFPIIMKNGKRFYCPYFILFVYKEKAETQSPPQFGFITSKKVGGAVERNKTRRIFSEIIRLEIPKIKNGFKAILITHKNAVEKDFAEIQSEIQKQLTLADLYK